MSKNQDYLPIVIEIKATVKTGSNLIDSFELFNFMNDVHSLKASKYTNFSIIFSVDNLNNKKHEAS